MEIDTRVFNRIMKENRDDAIGTIADSMQEGVRFGWGSREDIEVFAENRLDAKATNEPWEVKI